MQIRRSDDRVLLVGCVKSKQSEERRAQDLYRSPLWRARRDYAHRSGSRWFILSAFYGLLDPDDLIAPYDLALADVPAAGRRAWAKAVAHSLEQRIGPLAGITMEIHAGGTYRRALEPTLLARGAVVSAPTAAIRGVGAQIAWYRAVADE